MNKAISKFKDKYKNEPQIDHVIDYLKSEYGNKKFINFNYEQALEKANIWTQKINEKNKGLKSSGKVEIIKEYAGGFKIVRLLDQESKDWEGLHMRHCVSSYKDHKGIYSLRDSNNFPHCSIETNGDKIQQIKGKANGRVSPKYVNFVLSFIQSIDLKLSNSDIKNLGYTNEKLDEIELEFLKEHFSNYKIIKIKDEEFLYVGNKLKLIKNFDSKNPDLLLYFCKYNQCFDAVKLLVKNGTDINSDYYIEFDEGCPLSLASANGHLDIVKFLIDQGVNVKGSNRHPFSPLVYACQNKRLSVAKFLLEKGADINPKENTSYFHANGMTPLRSACIDGYLDVVKFLVDNGADINYQQDDIPLIISCMFGHLEIVKFLVEKGADIHTQNNGPLCSASEHGYLEIVKFLVKKGADISTRNNYPLHIANENKHLEVVKFLIDTEIASSNHL